MMKKILLCVGLLAGLNAAAQDFEGRFFQTKTLKVSGKTVKSEGTIRFTAPDQLTMLYTTPEGDYFIIDGDKVRMKLPGVKADVDARNNKLADQQRKALLNSMQGQYEQIAEDMDAECAVTAANGGKHVVLTIRKARPKSYTGMEMDYNAKGVLTRLVLEEYGGVSTEYILQ